MQPANHVEPGECPLPSGESPFNQKRQPLENAKRNRTATKRKWPRTRGRAWAYAPTKHAKKCDAKHRSQHSLAIKLWFWRKLSTVIRIESDDRDSFLLHNHTRIAKRCLRAPQGEPWLPLDPDYAVLANDLIDIIVARNGVIVR